MKIKSSRFKILFLTMFIAFCTIVSPLSVNVNAALANHVTGDDIVNTGLQLKRNDFTYQNIGTCTGFVTRVLMHLKVAKPLVSRNDNWNYCYTESGWNQPGYKYTAAYGPDGFYTEVRKMVQNGDALYIGTFTKSNIGGHAAELRNGDLIVTRKEDKNTVTGTGHVAFIHIANGNIYTLGAGAGVNGGVSDGLLASGVVPTSMQSVQLDDISISDYGIEPYAPGSNDTMNIFRLVEGTQHGKLRIEKKDTHDKLVLNNPATFWVVGPSYPDGIEVSTNNEGYWESGDIEAGAYTVTERVAPSGMLINTTSDPNINVAANTTNTYTMVNNYPRGSVKLVKQDAINPGNTKGDATLEGASYTLRAKNDIYEGQTRIHTKDAVIATVQTDATGSTTVIDDLPVGTYYFEEVTAPIGFVLNSVTVDVTVSFAGSTVATIPTSSITHSDRTILGNIEISKRLEGSDYDPEVNLAGAKFKLTLVNDSNQVYYTNVSGSDGICKAENIPYGTYTVSEVEWPASAFKVADFTTNITEDGQTYRHTLVDKSKKMQISVTKQILVNQGEATDAKVSGAIFTVYRDANCTQRVCNIGPTNESGYAISKKMRTGTYYLKETTFPEGIDPDAKIPGENVTYRNKVYTVSSNNVEQTDEVITVPITVKNEPNRNSIEILKEISKTSNTPQFPLDQCEFTATLISTKGTDHVFSRKCTAPTTRDNGYCIIENLPYGEYEIEETTISPISLKCENFRIFVEQDKKIKIAPYGQNIVDKAKVMQIKIRKVDKDGFENGEAIDYTQGDAKLNGAIYQIYRYDPQTDAYTEYVYDITVNHKDSDGYWCAESRDLLVGKYMVKEKIKYSETVEGVTYNYSYAEGYLTDPEEYYFDQRPDLQTQERSYHSDISKEEVIRGSVFVVKHDEQNNASTEVPSEGAKLRLTLDSSKNTATPVYYDVVIDNKGYGEFIDKNDDIHTTSIKSCYGEKSYPATIPYGKYTITEVNESKYGLNTSFFIQPEDVIIERQVEKQYRLESDDPVELYIRIQKRDKDTGATVELEGAKFKIWNMKTKSWVSQMSYKDGGFIDEFTTDSTGKLNTPEKVLAGEYIVYETKAPEGYELCEELRVPKQSDIGVKGKGGKYINATKSAMGIPNDTASNKNDYFYVVDMSDYDLKVKLRIVKTGEMITSVTTKTTEYGELYTPVYDQRGLKGVKYEIRAAENIMSPDGRTEYEHEGTLVATIVTGEDGIAETGLLHPGTYSIKEVETPEGYITDENIPNVTLESSKNELEYVKTTVKELTDERQKLEFSFEKEFEDVEYSFGEEFKPEAEFAVYSDHEIKDINGNVVIGKNKLMDIIKVDKENKNVTSNVDLPQGKYYAKEEKVSYPYITSTEKKEFELIYNNTTDPFVVKQLSKVVNDYDYTDLTLIKVSSSIVEGIKIKGDEVDLSEVDKKAEELVNIFNNMTLEQVIAYIEENKVPTLQGAVYGLYLDEDGNAPVYKKDETTGKYRPVEVTSGKNGIIHLDKIPLGSYFLKELKAPDNAELKIEAVPVDLSIVNKGERVYRILNDVDVIYPSFTKLDAFTGQAIENCVFEVTDKEGNVICHSITNEKGIGHIPTARLVDGETYYYTEISAPEKYNLNTEPHPFVAKLNEKGEWIGGKIEVENIRKTSKVTLTKLDMVDSTVIPNCKFELKSLETDWVKVGVTDENGVYVFEDVPYGEYTYTELEAPEEYLIDTEPHKITIDAEDVKIVVKDDRAPDTGDISMASVLIVTIVCALGIAFVIINNKKQQVK